MTVQDILQMCPDHEVTLLLRLLLWWCVIELVTVSLLHILVVELSTESAAPISNEYVKMATQSKWKMWLMYFNNKARVCFEELHFIKLVPAIRKLNNKRWCHLILPPHAIKFNCFKVVQQCECLPTFYKCCSSQLGPLRPLSWTKDQLQAMLWN